MFCFSKEVEIFKVDLNTENVIHMLIDHLQQIENPVNFCS